MCFLFVEEKENDDLILSFMVTQIVEIEDMILKWIPYIRVVSPLSLKDTIKDRLLSYIKT